MFQTFIYQPILNIVVGLYTTIGFGDLGVSIILATIGVRILLLPFSLKTARSQRAMSKLAPEIDALKKKHTDTTAQSAAIMQLYKERGVSPLGGCLPLLIQFPILIGMYRVFLHIFDPASLELLYSFIRNPGTMHPIAFGFLNVSAHSPALAVLAGVTQFIQAKMSLQPGSGAAAAMNTQMLYILPVMITVISFNMPAGIAVYWVTNTLISIGEQLYLRRS